MENVQAYVVEMLGLEVSEEVNGKLLVAENNLSKVIKAKKGQKDSILAIRDILTNNEIEFSDKEFGACVNSYKMFVKSDDVEFSPNKKKIVTMDIDVESFKETGLKIEIDEDTVITVEDPNEDSIEEPTSIEVHQFVLETISNGLEEMYSECKCEYGLDDEVINKFVYWVIRGEISLVDIMNTILEAVDKAGIIKDPIAKAIIKAAEKVIRVMYQEILQLSSLSNSTDIELVKNKFNDAIENVEQLLMFIPVFPDNVIDYVKLFLLGALDSFVCAELCGISEVVDIDESEINSVLKVVTDMIDSDTGIKELFSSFSAFGVDNKENNESNVVEEVYDTINIEKSLAEKIKENNVENCMDGVGIFKNGSVVEDADSNDVVSCAVSFVRRRFC